jgi:hypothetical protein
MTIIDTPDGIAHFQMARCIAALKIQASTGMTLSGGSMVRQCQRAYGVKSNQVKKALAEMLVLYKEKYGKEYGA